MYSEFHLLPTVTMTPRWMLNTDILVKICFICVQWFALVYSDNFVSEPSNQNVYEGTTIILDCKYFLEDTQSIRWFEDNSEIRQNGRYEVKYDILPDLKVNYAILHISRVEMSDAGRQFYCAVYENNNKIAESQRAVLNVTRVPSTTSPECHRINTKYNEGEEVEVVCAQDNTNPRVNLAIYKGREKLSDISKNNNGQRRFKYISKFIANRSDDGVVLTCSQTPPKEDYPKEFRQNCSFGTLNVNYAPIVSINGVTKVVLNKGGKQQEVVYVCTSTAQPGTDTYEWDVKVFPSDPSVTHTEQHNGNTLRLVLRSSTVAQKVSLTCTAINRVGSTGKTQDLHVIHNSDPESVTTQTPVPAPEFTWSTALILAVTGSCGLCIALFTAVIIGFYHFQLPQSMDIYGERIAQPEVYFEPKDGISSPQMLDGKHSVGVQVSELTDIESVYTEVSEYGIKKEKDKTLPENNSYSHV